LFLFFSTGFFFVLLILVMIAYFDFVKLEIRGFQDLNWNKGKISKNFLENRDVKWPFNLSKDFGMVFKLMVVLEYHTNGGRG